ncbi:hypothetical protein BU23DRAFT_145809 [Bimuria novae-zelandiae CBS 107.79]|uniref:Uncharacterized protein n=1 Tax=Bimuria novae-zelandiae CBS 107.79 TaxID=1447943 RepID=A0A6A5V715_9PLEO|nr:hypothetical protein BU23DRAFT_145809 [Bimuria novae-zelandiae CBS 107.79]
MRPNLVIVLNTAVATTQLENPAALGRASKLCFSVILSCESAVLHEIIGLVLQASRCSSSPPLVLHARLPLT